MILVLRKTLMPHVQVGGAAIYADINFSLII